MFNLTSSDEPPLHRIRHALTRSYRDRATRISRSQFVARAAYWLLPVALVVAVSTDSLRAQSSYTSDLRSYVTLEPKAKMTAFTAIDAFTPIVEESNDAEPVVIADTIPSDLIVAKTNPVKTDQRADTPVAPVVRTTTVSHTVEPGETLSGIAVAYGVNIDSIRVENAGLTNVDRLTVGDNVQIPPRNYDPTYIASILKTRTAKTTVASTSSSDRSVVVRSTSAARYDDDGQPSFQRPAGALGRNGYHTWAIDVPPSGGTTIKAAADGVVVEVSGGWDGGYGNKVIIDHGSGWQTLYAHLASISVQAGQKVGAGQSIGIMGATGRVYPAGAVHLHFEIRKNGQRLNPINFIK